MPIFPYYGDDNDIGLNLLEQYLLKLKWENDVRIPISKDFYFINPSIHKIENMTHEK